MSTRNFASSSAGGPSTYSTPPFAFPVSNRSHTRSTTSAKRKLPDNRSQSPESGPSRKKKKKKRQDARSYCAHAYGEDIYDDNEHTMRMLDKQLRDACDEVAHIKEQFRASEAQHMHQRQDMFLELLTEKDKAAAQLKTEQCRLAKLSQRTKNELEHKLRASEDAFQSMKRRHELERKSLMDDKTQQINIAQSTIYGLEADLEYSQRDSKTYQDDLADLRRWHIADEERQERQRNGLPPAYGNLDDVDVQPPWDRHEDGGHMHIATMKHLVRERFNRDMARALRTYKRRFETSTSNSACRLFLNSSVALAQACWCLKNFIFYAKETAIAPREKDGNGEEIYMTNVSKPAHMADRVAKLIIDFSWQILAAFDARHIRVKLTGKARSDATKNMLAVDDVLLQAVETTMIRRESASSTCIQCLSDTCPGHCERLKELQYFLTLIKVIADRFDKLTECDPTSSFFQTTLDWLNDNVEVERTLLANAELPPTRQMSPAREEELVANATAQVTAELNLSSANDRLREYEMERAVFGDDPPPRAQVRPPAAVVPAVTPAVAPAVPQAQSRWGPQVHRTPPPPRPQPGEHLFPAPPGIPPLAPWPVGNSPPRWQQLGLPRPGPRLSSPSGSPRPPRMAATLPPMRRTGIGIPELVRADSDSSDSDSEPSPGRESSGSPSMESHIPLYNLPSGILPGGYIVTTPFDRPRPPPPAERMVVRMRGQNGLPDSEDLVAIEVGSYDERRHIPS